MGVKGGQAKLISQEKSKTIVQKRLSGGKIYEGKSEKTRQLYNHSWKLHHSYQ